MKTTVIVIGLLLTLLLSLFFVRDFMSRSGEALGLVGGQLSKCPENPNCVCSEVSSADSSFVLPVTLPVTLDKKYITDSWGLLKTAIHEEGGIIQTETTGYLAVTFTSAVFGFVDDLEVRLDESLGVIHIRSASRVGRSDFGANRKRIESLKRRYTEHLSEALKIK